MMMIDATEQRLSDLGVNIYDLRDYIHDLKPGDEESNCRMVMRAACRYAESHGVTNGDIYPVVPFVLHLVDLIDRCESRINNLVVESSMCYKDSGGDECVKAE